VIVMTNDKSAVSLGELKGQKNKCFLPSKITRDIYI
jgi:hypothetical protein